MTDRVPGYVGLCTYCRKVVKLALKDLDLKDGEQLVGYVCEACTEKMKESNGSNTLCAEQGGSD
jgi:hypothetical protein